MGERSPTAGWRIPASSSSGLGRHCGRRRHGRHRIPGCHSGMHRRLSDARHLSRRLPSGGRSRACPRRCLLCRLCGSGRGGRRLPPFGKSPSPIALLLLLVRRRVLRSRRGGESQLLAQPKLLTPLFPALPSPDPRLFLVRHPLLLPPLRPARALGLGAWAGRTARRSRSRAVGNKRKVRPRRCVAREWQERKREPYSPAGPRGAWERPEVVVAVLDGLEVDGAPHPRGRVLLRKGIGQQL
jgi:hypothetical protein